MGEDVNGKVNIVIPLYNQQEYIEQCLRSAISQTYGNFDVTVVDDGSTDRSKEIAIGTSWGNRKVQIITQENAGLSAARNMGFAGGNGEFILPLDSDDWIDSTYLEKTVAKMADPLVAIVSTDMQYEGKRHERIAPRGTTLRAQMDSNNLPVCSLIRRKAFEATPRYRTISVDTPDGRVFGYEDWCLWLDILKQGWQVAAVNEPLFHYRLKEVSMITKATKYRKELTEAVHRLHPDLWGAQ